MANFVISSISLSCADSNRLFSALGLRQQRFEPLATFQRVLGTVLACGQCTASSASFTASVRLQIFLGDVRESDIGIRPAGIATRCSPDRNKNPTQTPSSQRSSNSQILSCVLGILNMTISAKFASLALDRLPVII